MSENFPSLRHVQKNNRPEKLPFIATNNGIVFAVRRSVNYFLLQIPKYFRKVWQKKKKLAIPKSFALQAKATYQSEFKTKTNK